MSSANGRIKRIVQQMDRSPALYASITFNVLFTVNVQSRFPYVLQLVRRDLSLVDPSETITVSFDIAENRIVDFIDQQIHKALGAGGHYVLNKAIFDHDNEWGAALHAVVRELIDAGAINQDVKVKIKGEMR